MLRYIAARIVQAVPVLFITSIAIFAFMRLLPGDPALSIAGMNARPEQVDAIRHEYQLDRPLPVQYTTWLRQLAQGDFGISIASKQPVSELLKQRIPVTLTLAIGAMVVAVGIGVPLGIFVAVRPGHPARNMVDLFNAVAFAVPSFWLGLLLLLLFSVRLGALPPSGYVSFRSSPGQAIEHLLLPAITLGVGGAALLARFVSASFADALQSDYVRTATAKGLSSRSIVWRHVTKNALPPIITVIAIQFGYLLGGAVIAESIFGWPGLGRLMVDAIKNRDYVVVQSSMLLVVVIFLVASVIADCLYAYSDPRIRETLR
jgi:peptide/nickel transport system permease protein